MWAETPTQLKVEKPALAVCPIRIGLLNQFAAAATAYAKLVVDASTPESDVERARFASEDARNALDDHRLEHGC